MSSPAEPRPPDSEFLRLETIERKPEGFEVLFLGPQGIRAGWRIGLYVALFLLCMTFLQLLAALAGVPLRVDYIDLLPGRLLTQEIMLFASAFAAAQVMALLEGRRIGDFGLPWRRAFRGHFWQGALWGLAEISLLLLLIGGLGGYSFGELALGRGEAIRYGLLWALVFLVVGFAEEFLFRGYIQFTLASGIGFWPAATLLSLVFGATHLRNPGESLFGVTGVFVIGMLFCLTLRRTGDIWLAVGWHATYDFGQAFLYSVPNSGTLIRGHLSAASLHGPAWLTGGAVGPEGSALAFVVLGAMFFAFERLYRPRRATPEPQSPGSEDPGYNLRQPPGV